MYGRKGAWKPVDTMKNNPCGSIDTTVRGSGEPGSPAPRCGIKPRKPEFENIAGPGDAVCSFLKAGRFLPQDEGGRKKQNTKQRPDCQDKIFLSRYFLEIFVPATSRPWRPHPIHGDRKGKSPVGKNRRALKKSGNGQTVFSATCGFFLIIRSCAMVRILNMR
jgi:hypothetical protein